MNATSALYDNSLQFRGEKSSDSSSLGGSLLRFRNLPLLLQTQISSKSKQCCLKLKSISPYWFSSICKQLSVLVRVSRSSLQTTVHILCLVGEVARRWAAGWRLLRWLFFSFRLLALHLFLSCNPSIALLSLPLHTNTRTKGWLQTRAVKLIINILPFVVCLQGQKFMGTSSIVNC